VSVKEVTSQGHSHQNNFMFVFAGNINATITNTLMFNIYDNQKNYHEVEINNKELEFLTTSEKTSFKIDLGSDSKFSMGNIVLVVLLCFVFISLMTLWFYKMKEKSF
ncbi:hypothetical protein, partial [Winogradskyella sp.]|uniref:hypothetical protein n=1 Tax=Winogradskyella sp. TaxID=1883156 RepID=UPI0025D10711